LSRFTKVIIKIKATRCYDPV